MLCLGCKREMKAHFIQHDETKIWYACGSKECQWLTCPACRIVYDIGQSKVRAHGTFNPTTFRAYSREEDVPRPGRKQSGKPPSPL